MKPDILNREDIEKLVNRFYGKVRENPRLGPYFCSVVAVNWDKHLLVMYDFWENIVFASGGYSGNPMMTHKKVNSLHAFSPADFDEWLRLFTETVDEFFEGKNALLIKQRAQSISTVMQMKILQKDS